MKRGCKIVCLHFGFVYWSNSLPYSLKRGVTLEKYAAQSPLIMQYDSPQCINAVWRYWTHQPIFYSIGWQKPADYLLKMDDSITMSKWDAKSMIAIKIFRMWAFDSYAVFWYQPFSASLLDWGLLIRQEFHSWLKKTLLITARSTAIILGWMWQCSAVPRTC